MSTSVIEPGTRLAGRFRLDDRVSEAGGSTFWKATDEILARPVAVLTFAPGFPRVHDVVTAARAASRLTDPRLTQVFDADDSGERAYVVSEWVTGETLEDLLAEGPMEPGRAAAFLLEAAEALTAAHAAGLAHLCLTPHNLVWTSGGTVKVTGLGVEAVLSGTTSDAPAIEDTQGLGHMLYAALTGHWCGAEGTQLPAAPVGHDGRPLAPTQLRAGVPHNLDLIVCRALHLPARGAQEPLSAPAAFADALAQVPRSPLPFVPLAGSTPPAVMQRPEASTQTAAMPSPAGDNSAFRTVPDPAPSRRAARSSRPQRTGGAPPARHTAAGNGISRPVLAAIAAGVLLIVAVGVWGLSQLGSGSGAKSKNGTTAPPAAKKTVTTLKPVKASVYNPKPHSDEAAAKGMSKVIDDSKSSIWTTQHYNDEHFGGYRSSIGLLIDMGRQVTVDKIKVTMPQASTPGTVELHVGNSGGPGMTKAATADAGGTFEVDASQAKGKYIMLLFTKLPNIGEYKIKVSNVAVYGTD